CIHQRIEARVDRCPDAPAVVCGQTPERVLSYRELDRRANQLAHHLRRLGVGPEVTVGLCLGRSLEMVVGMLAVLKAGGVYLPLDPGYPAERLGFMLGDAGARVLLTVERLAAAFPELISEVERTVVLDREGDAIARSSGGRPTAGTTSRNLAYVIYTSGSTGRPKGVCCHHAGVLNLLADFDARQPIAEGDGCSWWTSPSFDVSVYEVFSPLLAGGTLHLVPERIHPLGDRFAQWLSERRIRSAYVPPFMLHDLAARPRGL
ncbi:MAG: AMP-binding protein, partial [bacterium]|nr:AMP-binding protein [bacterium]